MCRHKSVIDALAARGHNLTILSTDIDTNAPANANYIHTEGVYDYMYRDVQVDLVSLHKETSTEAVRSLYAFGIVSCLGTEIKLNPQFELRFFF